MGIFLNCPVIRYYGIYNNLKDLRLSIRKTQKQLANGLNLSLKSYIKYENASIRINIQLMKNFADYYKTSLDYITCLTDETKPHAKSIVEWDNKSKSIIKS